MIGSFRIIEEIKNMDVFNYLHGKNVLDVVDESDEVFVCHDTDMIRDLLLIGVTVMNSMNVNNDMQNVKIEIERLENKLFADLKLVEDTLTANVQNVVQKVLDINDSKSEMAKVKIFMDDVVKKPINEMLTSARETVANTTALMIQNAEKVSTDKLTAIENGITKANDNFNPDLETSYLGKMKNIVIDVQENIKTMLDFSNSKSFAFSLKEETNKYFGKDSPVVDAVQEIITAQQRSISEELTLLREVIAGKQGANEMLSKTAIKGMLFEDELEVMLNAISHNYGEVSTRTSKAETGSKSKKGDFVYEFSDLSKSVVIEAKDESVGLKPMLKYMDEAMTNRGCELGILVTKFPEQLPNDAGLFNIYENNKIFCDARNIVYALRFARMYLYKLLDAESVGISFNEFEAEYDKVLAQLTNIKNVKTKVTSVKKAVDNMYDDTTSILDEMKNSITEIMDNLYEKIKLSTKKKVSKK